MVRQISIYMIANLVSAMFGFASVVLFTRILSPHEYGIYIIGTGIAGIISTLLFGWIKVSVLRFESEGGTADIRMTAFYSYAGLLLLSPVVIEATVLISGNTTTFFLPAVYVAMCVGLFEFVQEIFRSRQQTLRYMYSVILRAALTLVFSYSLVSFFDLGGQGLLISVGSAYLVSIIIFARSVWAPPLLGFDFALFKNMLRFGVPMTISGGVFVLHNVLDRLIILAYSGETAAGIYGASADLVRQIVLFPAVAIGSAMVPIAIRALARGDTKETDRHLVSSMELLLSILMPAVAGLALIATEFSGLILGPEFREAAGALIPVLVVAWLFRAISYQYVHVSFQLAKKPWLLGVHGLFILAVNVVGMLILVPRFEVVGAAWALLIAEIAGAIIGYFLSFKAYRLPFELWPVVKVLVATLAMAIPTFIVGRLYPSGSIGGLILPIVTGVVVYSLAAVVLDLAGIRSVVKTRLRLVHA